MPRGDGVENTIGETRSPLQTGPNRTGGIPAPLVRRPRSRLDAVGNEIHRPPVIRRCAFASLFLSGCTLIGANQEAPLPRGIPARQTFASDAEFLELLQRKAFDYFWLEANSTNGLVRDRSRTNSYCSIAAVGFGLTAIGIGIDHGWIAREQGRERILRTSFSMSSVFFTVAIETT